MRITPVALSGETNAFVHAILRPCLAKREVGISYVPTHELAANWSNSFGLKTSKQIAKTPSWHVLRYLPVAKEIWTMPSKYSRIVPVFGLLTAFTLMVGSASAQVSDQPRPQPGAPGRRHRISLGRSQAHQRSRRRARLPRRRSPKRRPHVVSSRASTPPRRC